MRACFGGSLGELRLALASDASPSAAEENTGRHKSAAQEQCGYWLRRGNWRLESLLVGTGWRIDEFHRILHSIE